MLLSREDLNKFSAAALLRIYASRWIFASCCARFVYLFVWLVGCCVVLLHLFVMSPCAATSRCAASRHPILSCLVSPSCLVSSRRVASHLVSSCLIALHLIALRHALCSLCSVGCCGVFALHLDIVSRRHVHLRKSLLHLVSSLQRVASHHSRCFVVAFCLFGCRVTIPAR